MKPVGGFQIQQAVEQSLKAWMLHLGDDPPLIHNIKALLQRLEATGACVADFRNLEPFTSFAVQCRYDTDPESIGSERDDWLRRAEDLIDHVALIIGVRV